MRTRFNHITLKHAGPFIIFFIAGFLIYSNTLTGEFLYDDIINITENPAVHSARNFFLIFRQHASRFFPYFSFALNYTLHQENPLGYHLINILLHVINTSLVFILTECLLKFSRFGRFSAKHTFFLSMSSALIFLAHPLQTQAVSSIVQRITVLTTTFYLGSIVLYLIGRLKNRSEPRMLSLILCLMAMASRESAATLPAVLCLLEYAVIHPSQKAEEKTAPIKTLIPFFLSVLIVPLLLLHSIDQGRSLAGISRETDSISRSVYFMTQARVISTYLSLFFLPVHQNTDYDYPLTHSIQDLSFISGAGVIILITFLMLHRRKKHMFLSLGWWWFLITLSVESSVIPIFDVIQEHRLYLPITGLAWMTSYSLLYLIKSAKLRVISLSVIVLILSLFTFSRNHIWRTETAFWNDAVKKSPMKSRPHMGLGTAYLKQGNPSRAELHLQTAVLLDPYDREAHCNLAVLYTKTENPERALLHIRTAYRLNPNNPLYIKNFAYICMETARYEYAFLLYKRLLNEFFSPKTADHYFHALLSYYQKTRDIDSTLVHSRELQRYFQPDHYEEVVSFLRHMHASATQPRANTLY